MRVTTLLLAMCAASISADQRAPTAPSTPCTTSTVNCAEWVTIGAGPGRSMIYTSYSLDRHNERIRRALILVHGTNRNADHYFSTAMAAAFLAGAVDDTVVVAPHFIACADKPDVNEVVWSCGGDSWRSGGAATSHPDLSSFDLADQILRKLATKNTFPNMQAIVVAGHSAGGQYVTRYEMANRVHDTLGVTSHLRRGQPVELRVAGIDAADRFRRRGAGRRKGWLEVGDRAYQLQFWRGPFTGVRQLQQVAAWS